MNDVQESKATKISNAVEFLRHVHKKSYSPAALRKYLIDKRGLTNEEVNIALMINKNRLEQEKHKSNKTAQTSSDRPVASTSTAITVRDVNFLRVNRRAPGQKLINEFLEGEQNLCATLECLMKSYHQHLLLYADQWKIQMTRKEVDEIFMRIPDLIKFHKRFYLDCKRGHSIAEMFMKEFKFLKGYLDYLKECQETLNKMRKYIKDSQMFFFLSVLRQKSSMQKSDMVDMLLAPLGRISVYRILLTRLYAWADKTNTKEYDLLGKASRRIVRLAAWIEKYVYGIMNQNEMDKVQRFLGIQHNIIVANRALIRYGPMIRRTSKWTVKNMRYIFFLFSDLLLWTSKNGRYENCLQLRVCEVIGSKSKNNPEKKFQVISQGKRNKKLRLECVNEREKNEWVSIIEKTISVAKQSSVIGLDQAWLKFEPNQKSSNGIEHSDDLSELDSELDSNDVSLLEDDDTLMIHGKKEHSDPEDPYNKRFLVTSNLKVQEFNDINTIDENFSNGFWKGLEQDEKMQVESPSLVEEQSMLRSNSAEDYKIERKEVKTEEVESDKKFSATRAKSQGSKSDSIVRRSRIGNHILVGKPSTSQITIRLNNL